jgi:hypothetical protein
VYGNNMSKTNSSVKVVEDDCGLFVLDVSI